VTNPASSLIIIGACAIIFFFGANLPAALALWPLESGRFEPWQLLSYGFFHGSFGHLFFNMFAVWMFGLAIEQTWGTRRFLLYYVSCLLAAAVTQIIVQQITGEARPTIGASGAVFGLLLAFGVMFPNNKVFLIFLPVPIKAKWFVVLYGLAELGFGLTGVNPSVAHFAHLGGLFGGAAVLWYWGWRPGMTWKL
jgi:membrane associated rhomboid family serine protease